MIFNNGNIVCLFGDDLIYDNYENKFNINNLSDGIKNEKIKCNVRIKYIQKMIYSSIANDDFCFDKFNNLHFTENYLIFYFKTSTNKFHLQIIEMEFTETLKKQIINYFSKSFLKEYQNEIYKKINKQIFGDELLIYIVNEFIDLVKPNQTKLCFTF